MKNTYYTQETLEYCDAGIVTLGNDQLRVRLATALRKVQAHLVRMVLDECCFLLGKCSVAMKEWAVGRRIILLPSDLLERDECEQENVILQQVALYLVCVVSQSQGHGVNENNSDHRTRQAEEQANKWINDWNPKSRKREGPRTGDTVWVYRGPSTGLQWIERSNCMKQPITEMTVHSVKQKYIYLRRPVGGNVYHQRLSLEELGVRVFASFEECKRYAMQLIECIIKMGDQSISQKLLLGLHINWERYWRIQKPLLLTLLAKIRSLNEPNVIGSSGFK